MDIVRAAVAIAVLLLFTAALGFLVSHVEAQDTAWSRFMYLYNGLEAIVFAAVGWLFGREVHRAQAQAAQARATAADQRADGDRGVHAGEARRAGEHDQGALPGASDRSERPGRWPVRYQG
jgi:hypothetical protein